MDDVIFRPATAADAAQVAAVYLGSRQGTLVGSTSSTRRHGYATVVGSQQEVLRLD